MTFASSIRRSALHWLTPVSRGLGHIGNPFIVRQIGFEKASEGLAAMRPGMVWLTFKRLELTNLFIPGHFTHAAIVSRAPGIIVEAVGEGVLDTTAHEFLVTKDEAVLLRPRFATDLQMGCAADWAYSQIGKPYDFELGFGNASFYCSELVYMAYQEVFPDSVWETRECLGAKTVIPQDYINAHDKWDIVWKSAA